MSCSSCVSPSNIGSVQASVLINNGKPVIGLFPEWYPQSAVLIAWPDKSTAFSSILGTIEKTYLEIVRAISLYQTVIIAVRNQQLKIHIKRLFVSSDIDQQQIIFVEIPYDDIWVRDMAPVAIQHNQQTHLLILKFNAWGNQYPHHNDSKFAQRLVATHVLPSRVESSKLILEGGAFDSNGYGSVLTTASCLYDQKRNHNSKHVIHKRVLDNLKTKQLIVLNNGHLVGDDTGGHIDTLARFCSEDTIVYTSCNNPDESHYDTLLKMYNELKLLETVKKARYKLLPLPLPETILNDHNQPLPANYTNFLVINHAVLVPQYNDKQDKTAQLTLGKCFPDRNIIPIDCRGLIQQYGSLHCMTMNYPNTLKPARIHNE